jgi:hypothetical protein
MSDWRNWFRGLVAAMIGGAAQVVAGFAVGIDPRKILAMAGVAAITNAAHYLQQSPLPVTTVTVKSTEIETVEVKKNS